MVDEPAIEVSHEEMEKPPGIRRYQKDELLGLQEAYGRTQEEWWEQLLKDLGPDVAEELHELQAGQDSSHFRRRSKNSERRLRSKAKREALHALSINSLESHEDGNEEVENFDEDSLDESWSRVNENTGRRSHVRKGSRTNQFLYTEDKPETESFQPPAFAVEGEPDFESGPPQDGWEYLRRVKYEAARCPKVVVAKIDPTKLVSEQTPYMPEMPDIPVCPPDLLPSKEWEEHFLGDFSLLRMALSNTRVPPKSTAERIPSLRNKAAWEVRCFGSITNMQDEDIVTAEGPTAESGDDESATQVRTLSLPSLYSATNLSDCATGESTLEPVDNEKEPPVPFIEHLETQLDQLFNKGCVETNYVIDLGLLITYVPNYEEWESSFNESEYLISGEPVEVDDDIAVRDSGDSFVGIPEPEGDPITSTDILDLHCSSVKDLGHVEDSSFGSVTQFELISVGEPEEQHGDNEEMKLPFSSPSSVYIEGDQLTTGDSIVSVHAIAHTPVHGEVESSAGIETQAEHIPTRELEDADNGIQVIEPSFSYLEVVDGEDDQLTTADFVDSLDGYVQQLEFGELHGGIESQFDSLSIQEPEVAEVEIPLFSYPETCEFEDVDLQNHNFINSLVGLEIYRSGNVFQVDLDKIVDVSGNVCEFKIDESLEELFTKVFQLVGVSQLPFIHLLLQLDEVSRAALFRYHVSWLENVHELPQDRALWLLALSAVVDTPLDAQTSAAFRAILRHCAGIRALKQTRDDEDLYMLNVLITVAGLYFGQAEANLS